LPLPRLRQREADQRPPVAVGVVDHPGVPDPPLAVLEHLGAGRGEPEVHAPPGALAAQQAAPDHPGERGTGRLLRDADPGERLDEAAREHAEASSVHVITEEGEHHRLRPHAAAPFHHSRPAAMLGTLLTAVMYMPTFGPRPPGGPDAQAAP